MSDRVTVSVIKADVGSVGGHARPHPLMMRKCEERLADGLKAGTIDDFYVTRVGDDINLILTHTRGENNRDVHGLCWEAFMDATKEAKRMKLYAAGQDLLTDAFSGNVRGAARARGMGSGAPVSCAMADKTEPSAYSCPCADLWIFNHRSGHDSGARGSGSTSWTYRLKG